MSNATTDSTVWQPVVAPTTRVRIVFAFVDSVTIVDLDALTALEAFAEWSQAYTDE
jgi:hypothetical protein